MLIILATWTIWGLVFGWVGYGLLRAVGQVAKQTRYPESALTPVEHEGLRFFRAEQDQCWNGPLPCLPIDKPLPTPRGSHLRDGFRAGE